MRVAGVMCTPREPLRISGGLLLYAERDQDFSNAINSELLDDLELVGELRPRPREAAPARWCKCTITRSATAGGLQPPHNQSE